MLRERLKPSNSVMVECKLCEAQSLSYGQGSWAERTVIDLINCQQYLPARCMPALLIDRSKHLLVSEQNINCSCSGAMLATENNDTVLPFPHGVGQQVGHVRDEQVVI
jgi:hypothetical protein